MKTATWTDGTQTIRETHTRDYKFAYKVTRVDGTIGTGFSISRKGAETEARANANWHLKSARSMAKLRMPLNTYNYSEEGIELIKLTKEALQNIEIVEVA